MRDGLRGRGARSDGGVRGATRGREPGGPTRPRSLCLSRAIEVSQDSFGTNPYYTPSQVTKSDPTSLKKVGPGFVNVLSDTSQPAFQESDAHEACTHTMHCSASARAGDHYTTTTARPPPLRHARAHTPRPPCAHLCMDAFGQASRTRATPAEVHLGHEHTRCTTTRPRLSPPSSRRPG